ncbi:MAG: DUF3047 domain-containing protein [Proteobacteria bacterium]|nr:DUF3047 domain-containing protein [Pseudomonadota bacterium]MBU1714434.1 DUF3047 domain-containing protein [Pseudomonadota bacterium]
MKAKITIFLFIITNCYIQSWAADKIIIIDNFKNGISANWEEKSFSGKTKYSLDTEQDRSCIKAVSKGTASGLFYKIDFDPEQYPIITWSWKVENILAKGDAKTKEGDDYAARIYVVFPSFFFWKTRAINYIWANKLPKETSVPNAYTSNAMMIAVESGPELTGQWLTETRNIHEDFKNLFGEAPPKVGAIAIMTDTDTTGELATAYYGPISIKGID